jgi:hypothetical protein
MSGINMANITAHPTTMLPYASNLRCLSGIQHVRSPISTTSAYPSTTAGTTNIHSGQPVLVAAFDTKSIQYWHKLLTEILHVLKLGVDACDMSTQQTAIRSGKRNTLQLMDRRWGCKRKSCFSMQVVSLKKQWLYIERKRSVSNH